MKLLNNWKRAQWAEINITKHLRRIPNALHFWFASISVFTAQYFKFSGLRCSPLNAALVANEENAA